MAIIITRSGKGSALLSAEVDANFNNLNSDKAENAITVQQTDIGTAANEIPLNQYLGAMAYQDRTAVNIGGGVATLGTATVTTIQNDTAISNVEPSLMLNFAAVEALDPRITYTRASTATYYNGVTTAVAEQNLLLQSQTFDNASWTKTNGTVTADVTVAPDGTSTADLFTENTATGVHTLQASGSSIANQQMVFSVFIKPNGRTVVRLDWENNDSFYVLATLTSSGTINGGSGTVTALANGWYRLALVTTPTLATLSFRIRLCESATGTGVTSYTGDGTSGIYVWGAQLEQRSAVSAYTPTTTQAITNYIPVLLTAASGVPRFDHNPISGDSLGFLVEEQRTNLVLRSEELNVSPWTQTSVTVSANQIIAPDGTLTGDKIISTSGNIGTIRQSSITVTNGAPYTLSCIAKAGEHNSLVIFITDGVTARVATLNLLTGVVSDVSSGLTTTVTQLGNGWYRFSGSVASSGSTSISLRLGSTQTGDGYSGIYIWGAQLEAGAFPTSYIATVASQVTRAADAASMTGTNFTSWFNAAQGTIYSESLYYYTGDAGESDAAGLGSPVAFGDAIQNQFQPFVLLNTSSRVRRSSSYYRTFLQALSLFESADNTYLGNTQIKSAVAMAANDYASSVNGATVRTSAVPFSVVGTRLVIGGNASQGNFSGTIKKIAYYPGRLSNEELQEMTS